MHGASGASAGIILVAGMLTAFSSAHASQPSGRASERTHPATSSEDSRSRERYRQSIAEATNSDVLLQLARTFDMAGLFDLAEDARKKATYLTQEQPAARAPEASAAAPEALSGSHFLLLPNTNYRARLSLGIFQCLGSRNKLLEKFSQYGFADVHVFMGEAGLPNDWPSTFRASRGRCARFAEGTWTGPAQVLQRPKAVDALWVRGTPSASVNNAGPSRDSS